MGWTDTYAALEGAQDVSDAAEILSTLSTKDLTALLEVVGISDGPNLLARLKGQPTDDVKARVARLRSAQAQIATQLEAVRDRARALGPAAAGDPEFGDAAARLGETARSLEKHADRLRDMERMLLPEGPDWSPRDTRGAGHRGARGLRVCASEPIVSAMGESWLRPPKGDDDPSRPTTLPGVFALFCGYFNAKEMNNQIFAKFSHDCALIDAKYARANVDLVWTKVAGKKRRVGLDAFLLMLDAIAACKGVARPEIDDHVLRHAHLEITGTRGSSKFYDDKANWTGVAKQGGPSHYDPQITLATMTNTGR